MVHIDDVNCAERFETTVMRIRKKDGFWEFEAKHKDPKAGPFPTDRWYEADIFVKVKKLKVKK